jgi:hypothetical protein
MTDLEGPIMASIATTFTCETTYSLLEQIMKSMTDLEGLDGL